MLKGFGSYFNAGIDGADEKDVGEDDEDADVKAEHERCSVEEKCGGSLGCTCLVNPS